MRIVSRSTQEAPVLILSSCSDINDIENAFRNTNVKFDDEKSDHYIPIFSLFSSECHTLRLYFKSYANIVYSPSRAYVDCFHPVEIQLSFGSNESQNSKIHKHIPTIAKILQQEGE